MKKIVPAFILILFSIFDIGISLNAQGIEAEESFRDEYRYILTSKDLGEAKTIQELNYFIAIDLDIRELRKIGHFKSDIIAFNEYDIVEKLSFMDEFMNSLDVTVYFKNTDKEKVEKGDIDLSKYKLISQESVIQKNIYLSIRSLLLEVTISLNETYDYLPCNNLEIMVISTAKNIPQKNIYFETENNVIQDILNSSNRVSDLYEYYSNDDNSKKYNIRKTSPYIEHYHHTNRSYTSAYPVTGIKYEILKNYPHKPKTVKPEYNNRIYSNSVMLKWETSRFADSFDLYLHKDKEKVLKLNKDALIRKKIESNQYLVKNLENGPIYYWLIVAKNKKTKYHSISDITQFLVDSNITHNKEEDSKIIGISSLEELRDFSLKPGFWDKSFILTKDIDASATKKWNNGMGFSPIGNEKYKFTGSFNGNNHKITNLYINRPKKSNVGFFGYLDSVLVKDLWIESATIRGLNNIGILAGVNDNNSKIINCHTSGEILCDYIYGNNLAIYEEFKKNPQKEILFTMNSGGLVGINKNFSIIKLSSSSAMVEGNKVVGGLVGENSSGSKILESFATGDVFGYHTVGGLVAQNIRYVPENDFRKRASARINYNIIQELEDYNLITEKEQDTPKTEIIKCFSSGTVSGEIDYVCDAVFVCAGYNERFDGFFGNTSVIGGLVGLNDSYITNSYTNSNIQGNSDIGILVGLPLLKISYNMYGSAENKLNYSKIINSFYNYDKTLLNGEKVKSQLGLSDALFSEWKNQYLSQTPENMDFSKSILIKTPEDLQKILFTMHNSEAKYELKTDLDLSKYPHFYIPVLYGVFDGNGYTIKNLSIDNQDLLYLGLFGEIIGGKVSNLILKNAKITGVNHVGILAGKITNEAIIENITVQGSIIDGAVIGGISAVVDNSLLTNCVSEIKIMKEDKKDDEFRSRFSDSLGRLKNYEIGGLIGICNKARISNCQTNILFMNNIDSSSNAGFIGKASNSKITESHSTASIKNSKKSAGFIASLSLTDIENCYSKSLITSQDNYAGLANEAVYSNITNSFSVCYIYNDRRLSSFIEENRYTNITNCYYEIEDRKELRKGNNEIYYADLKKKETYSESGWDFDNIWEINKSENQGYPTLKRTKTKFMQSFYEPELKKAKTNIEKNEIKSLNNSMKTVLQEFKMNLNHKTVSKINQINEINNKEQKNDKGQWVDLDKIRAEKVYAQQQNRISKEKNSNEDIKENYIVEYNKLASSGGNNHLDMNIKRKMLIFTAGGLIFVILIFVALKLLL